MKRLQKIITSVVLATTWVALSATAAAEDPDKNWRLETQSVYQQFANDMQIVSQWCRDNGLPEQANQTLAMVDRRDPGRQYVFLPHETSEKIGSEPVATDNANLTEWRTRIAKAKSVHAQRVFQLAQQACAAGDGTRAFTALHEVLHFDSEHEQAHTILGHRKTDEGWQIAPERIKVKTSTKPHSKLSWPAKRFIIVSTAHFNIASRADEQTTRRLAEKLERWHDVWRQVFFEYWSKTSILQRWFDGKGKARIPGKKFDVVFFADKDQYVQELQRWVNGVEGSTGYYDNRERHSFFYASDEGEIQDTWRHEATHQWFQETIRGVDEPFEESYAWLGEGIALYFESLTDFGEYVTLGGFDSQRLQFARIRRMREGYQVPLAEASSLGRVDFQARPDLRRLYSQSAGVAHLLMDGNNGQYQRPLTEFLKLTYQGKLKPDTFEKLMGTTLEELEKQYDEYLKVDNQTVVRYLSQPETRTRLALTNARIDDEAMQNIGRCKNLIWLDLTQNDVRGKTLMRLSQCDQLTQLFLSGCLVDRASLESLAGLQKLQDLDLSASSVEDQHLDAISNLPALKSLRLAGTRVSDAKIKDLANKFPGLDVKKD